MKPGSQIDRATSIAGLAISSAMFTIFNYLALSVFPFPAILTAVQCVACSLLALSLGRLHVVRHDPLHFKIAKKFFPAVAVLCLSIFANFELRKHSNRETILVLHSVTTILVAFGEASHKKGLMRLSREAVASLFIVIGGAVAYVLNDAQFVLKSCSWAMTFLLSKTIEMVYRKHLVMATDLKTWNLVLYTNLLSLVFAPAAMLLNGETSDLLVRRSCRDVAIALTLSSLFSVAVGFYGYESLKAVSATTCVVVDVLSELPSTLVQAVLREESISLSGIVSLLICILGAVIYCRSQTGDDANALLPAYSSDFTLDISSSSSSIDADFEQKSSDL